MMAAEEIPIYVPIVTFGWVIFIALMGIFGPRIVGVKKITREEWAVAGRSLRAITNFMTASATQRSALTFMGFIGLAYMIGAHFSFTFTTAYMIGCCFFFIMFGTKLWRLGKKHGDFTPTDVISRYLGGGKWFRLFFAAFLVAALIPYIQAQVLGAGWVLESATGGAMPAWAGALFIYLVVLTYVWLGGVRSIAYTDFTNGCLMLFYMLVVPVIVVYFFGGGFVEVFSKALSTRPDLLYIGPKWSPLYAATWGFVYGAGWAFHAHMWIRMLTPKSEFASRAWAATIYTETTIDMTFFYFAALTLAVVAPPVIAGVKPDLVFVTSLKAISPVLWAVCLAAIMAALLSTLDSQVHALGLVIGHDIVEGLRGKMLSEKGFLWTVRLTCLILVGLGYLLALFFPQPLGWLGVYPATIGMILMPVCVYVITGQKWVTKEGVVAGLVAAAAVMVLFSGYPWLNPGGIYYGFWATLVAAFVTWLVSMFTRSRPSPEAVKDMKEAGW
jgi:SSS family solute:Na+ symporter